MTQTDPLNIHAKLAEKAAEATDLHLLIQSLISEAICYMEAASGSIMVFDKEENCLKLYVSSSHPALVKSKKKGPIAKITINDSIAAQVFKTGKAIVVDTSKNLANKVNLSRAKDQGSFISLPLKISQKTVGVINFNRTSEQPAFTDNDLNKFKGIDTLIASQIDKETLLEKIESNRREVNALYEMSSMLSESNDFAGRVEEFLVKLSNELDMKRSAVIRMSSSQSTKNKANKSNNQIEIIAANHLKLSQLETMFDSVSERIRASLTANIVEIPVNDEPIPLTLLFEDSKETSELYCIPLNVEDDSSYFLIVSKRYTELDETQTKKHYKFLQIISHNLSNAITREIIYKRDRELQETLRQSAERNRIFFDISKDLGSTLDPYVILQKAFNQFRKIIDFTTISVLLFDDIDSSYNLIVQPSESVSIKYQQKLSDSIFKLFSEYPAEPAISPENFKQPVFFKPQTPADEPIASYKQVLHLPIVLSNGVKGLIHLARKQNNHFTPQEFDITSQFTGIFITSIKNALIHKRTEKLAFTDPLTELYNHRYFQETLSHEFIRTSRYEKPLSLMIMDIDFFKKFNDTYGHLVGDKVLKHVAAIFKSSIREQIDTVARYGGEEFAVILPETSIEGAAKFADRIRKKVEESRVIDGERELKVTISVGVSCTTVTKCSKTSDLIEAADQALYTSKANGRNQVQTFKDSIVDYEKSH